MNHLPYKDWLLSDTPLSPEQAEALQEHLRNCETCQQFEPAWIDVHALIKKAQAVDPLPGFADRWQKRFEVHRLSKQRRLAWYIVAIIGVMAITLIAIFGAQLSELLNSPGNLILLWVSRLTGVLSIYWAFENMLNGIAAQLPSFTWLMLIFGIGVTSFLSVAWLATYRKLTLVRRIV